MAETASDYNRGDQDIHAQQETFHAVLIATKWATLHVAVLVLFLTLWFCTSAGFFEALFAGVALSAIGIFALHERPSAH